MSRYDSGGSSMNTRLPVIFDWISDDELFANAFCSTLIITRPGTRKLTYSTPGYTSTRPDSAWPKIVRYSNAVTIGASTVWNDTFQKRSSSL